MNFLEQSDPEIIKLLAERVKRKRLRMNMTQREAAERAGVHYNTISKFEQGNDITLLSFIQILRALDELEAVDMLLPQPTASPVELLKRKGRERRRASGKPSDGEDSEW